MRSSEHMSHHPEEFKVHQGWSVNSAHPSRDILNVETIFDHLAKLYPSTNEESNAEKAWVADVESFVQAHTEEVLSSPLFVQAPISAVQRILSLPCLSISEDFVLSKVLLYATDAANVLSPSPAFWSAEEREVVLPVLLQLFPFVRTFSLSTKQFVLTVEPMKILSTADLIQKYKFDALARQLGAEGGRNTDTHTLATIRRCYKDRETRHQILQERLRGSVAIAESPHPYLEGEEEVLEEISVEPWAPRMFVEFDRRSEIGIGARLVFYKDPDAREVLGSWHEMWPACRHGVKCFVVDSHRLFVGFSSCFFEPRTAWGWKLFARPLFRSEDFT